MLLLPDGRLVPMRCGASNRCAYCAWLVSVENSLVVGLDARWSQPTVGLTLTTHRANFDLARFREGTAQLVRWLREDAELGPAMQYLALMEWMTGKSGHGRIPHAHTLLKNVSPRRRLACTEKGVQRRRDRCGSCHECTTSRKWETITGGAWKVDLRELHTPGGAIAYMVGHHHKREQAPPLSARGVKRMRPSKGYFDVRQAEMEGRGRRPIHLLREQAKHAMREATAKKGNLAKLIDADVPEHAMDEVLEQLLEQDRDRPPAVPVKCLDDGRLMHLSTGEIFDGPGAAVYELARRAA